MKRLAGMALAALFAGGAAADTVLWQMSGQGEHTTRPFHVSGPWEIQWKSSGEIFQIYVFDDSGAPVAGGANQLGPGSGSSFNPKAGRYYMMMNAMGRWDVKVVRVN